MIVDGFGSKGRRQLPVAPNANGCDAMLDFGDDFGDNFDAGRCDYSDEMPVAAHVNADSILFLRVEYALFEKTNHVSLRYGSDVNLIHI